MNVHRLYNNKYSYRNREPRLRFFKYSPSQYHRGSDKKIFWRQSVFISRRESRVSPSNPSLSLVHSGASTGPGRFPSNFNRGPAKKTRPGDTRAAGALFESRCFSLVVSARTTRGALLSLSLSVTPSARCGVVSGQRRAAWRPCQALLFSPGLCKIRPLCSSTTDLSTRFIHQPNPILFLPLSYRSSSPLSPPLSLSVSLSLVSPAPSKFVPSYSQPYQRPRVCVSTSTFTGACLRSNTRFLRPRVEHPPLCPRAHSTLHSLARSLALAPLPRPFSSTFHFVAVRPRGTLLNTVNNRRKEPLPVCKPCTVRPWLRFTYRRGDGPMRAAFDHVPREIHRIPDQTRPGELRNCLPLLKYSDGITVYTEEENI